jgi:hypothetical protein
VLGSLALLHGQGGIGAKAIDKVSQNVRLGHGDCRPASVVAAAAALYATHHNLCRVCRIALVEFCKPSASVIFSLPSALSSLPPRRAMVRPTIGTNPRGSVGSGQKPDPTGSADGDEEAKAEKQEAVAAGAKSITDSICRGRNGAQYGRDNCNIRICVAVPGGCEASHIRDVGSCSWNYFR